MTIESAVQLMFMIVDVFFARVLLMEQLLKQAQLLSSLMRKGQFLKNVQEIVFCSEVFQQVLYLWF